jgi:hypothetical protein
MGARRRAWKSLSRNETVLGVDFAPYIRWLVRDCPVAPTARLRKCHLCRLAIKGSLLQMEIELTELEFFPKWKTVVRLPGYQVPGTSRTT